MSGKLTGLLTNRPLDLKELRRYGRLLKLDVKKLVILAKTYTYYSDKNSELTLFHVACINSKPDIIKILVDEGWSVDMYLDNVHSPICIALESGNVPVTHLLVTLGANILSMSPSGLTPIASALYREKGQKAIVSCTKVLLDAGVPVNAVAIKKAKQMPIHIAVYNNLPMVVRFLLKAGADVDSQDQHGYTPLHIACLNNSPEIIKLLTRHSVDLYKENELGQTPLQAAVIDSTYQTVEVLLKNGCDIKKDSAKGVMTSLHLAIDHCISLDLVKLLVTHGADVNVPVESGTTPLHMVAKRFLSLLPEKSSETLKDIAEFLVAKGGNVNVSDVNTSTPLSIAMDAKDLSLAKLFMQLGADLNMPGNKGLFHKFISHCDLIVHFLEFGGDYNECNVDGHTPYHLAILAKLDVKLIKTFVKHGCPYNQNTIVWKSLVKECDSESILNFFVAEERFFKGIEENDFQLVTSAMNDGAVPTGCCEENKYPLHFVAYNGNVELLTFLLEKKTPANILNDQGKTALHVAAKRGNLEICCTLLRFGASYNYSSKKCPNKLEVEARGEEVHSLFRSLDHFFHMASLGKPRLIEELQNKLRVNIREYLIFANATNVRGETLFGTALRREHRGIANQMMNLRVTCDIFM